MKDRLVGLLTDTFNYTKGVCIDFDEAVEINADHLLANGVIVPPCKVGDLIFMPWEYGGTSGVALLDVTYMVIDKDELRIMTDFSSDDEEYFDRYNGGVFYPSDFGKTVFLTREEAVKALERRKG